MPSVAWPPYIYANSRGGFSGPLDFATLIAGRLGLTVRYKTYPYYAGAQQALLDGEVDMLIGVTPSQSRQQKMRFTSDLMTLPRGVLLAREEGSRLWRRRASCAGCVNMASVPARSWRSSA